MQVPENLQTCCCCLGHISLIQQKSNDPASLWQYCNLGPVSSLYNSQRNKVHQEEPNGTFQSPQPRAEPGLCFYQGQTWNTLKLDWVCEWHLLLTANQASLSSSLAVKVIVCVHFAFFCALQHFSFPSFLFLCSPPPIPSSHALPM